MKNIIRKYIEEDILTPENHFSYCSYPFEGCICKKIEVTDDLQLITGGYLDSMDLVGTVDFIEKTFDVVINDTDITRENFESINIIADFITKIKK